MALTALERHEKLVTRYAGSGCRRKPGGQWQHYEWNPGGKPVHVGPCEGIDHHGFEPWKPWPSCGDKAPMEGNP